MTERGHILIGRARDEGGFTLVEVLVALFLLVVGGLAAFHVLDASTRATFRAERSQAAVNYAQRELERLRRLDYDEIALTSTPTQVSDPADPRDRVSGTTFDLDRGSGSDPAEMVVDAVDGKIAPGPTAFDTGRVSGNVYRFVVWRDEPGCVPACQTTSEDFKRIVVAVTLSSAPNLPSVSGVPNYQELVSDFINPHDGVLGPQTPDNPNPGDITTAQQFWLYDTPCAFTTRQDQMTATGLTNAHMQWNTLGTCDDAYDPGGSPAAGPPNLMWNSAPPDPDPNDSANPPVWDYDYDADVTDPPGLAPAWEDPGCGAAGNLYTVETRWVSNAMPDSFAMSGRVSLVFYTRTMDALQIAGGVCAYLYHAGADGSRGNAIPVQEDSACNSGCTMRDWYSFGLAAWPTSWQRESFTMKTAGTTIESGNRLGLAITTSKALTPGGHVLYMYDHPDHQTRLEVETTTPLG